MMRRRSLLALICTAALISPAAMAEEDPDVVEIMTQNKYLIGTGTVISYTGLVLTAKHILIDKTEAGNLNLRAAVRVRFKDASNFEYAELIAIHPYLDLAVLQLQTPSRQPIPASIEVSPQAVKKDRPVHIIGHAQNTGEPDKIELNQSKDALIDEIDRDGHIIVGRMVQKGTSGGPVFLSGRLIGIVRTTDVDRTIVVPIVRAVDFFRTIGIFISGNGVERRSGDIATLASKIDRFERLLGDIELDFVWTAALSEKTSPSPPPSLQLAISYQRKLAIQPAFEDRVSVYVTPRFKDGALPALNKTDILDITYSDWFKGSTVEFNSVRKDLDWIINRYRAERSINVSVADLEGLDVRANVYPVGEQKYIRPRPFSICFGLRPVRLTVRSMPPRMANGSKCSENLDVGQNIKK
jgi:Trypsin-like peptidase domain